MSLQSAVTGGFEGDVVKRAENHNASSAQEELARFQLLKEKLKARSDKDETVQKVLGQLSDEELVALQVLENINAYPEASPEASQLYMLTGTKDRFAQAQWFSKHVIEQERARQALTLYGPNKDAVRGEMYYRQAVGVERRLNRLKDDAKGIRGANATKISSATKIGDSFRRFIGMDPAPAPVLTSSSTTGGAGRTVGGSESG